MFRAAAIRDHGTRSTTENGMRLTSENALSQVIVAQDCGSWFPCTITTTGKDITHTCQTIDWDHSFGLDLNFERDSEREREKGSGKKAMIITFNCMSPV